MNTLQQFRTRLTERAERQIGVGPAITVHMPVRRHDDADMMYAWSIGTTRVAQEPPATRREALECPPEVYIG